MPQSLHRLLAACFLLLLAALLPAQSVAGDWTGAIELPGRKMAVTVHLAEAEGGMRGTIDIPAQGAKALPLGGFEAEDNKLQFAIADIPGDPVFDGELSADGASLAGDFRQNGATFPFTLARVTANTTSAFDDFQAWCDESRSLLHVPGCAVAVIKGGTLLRTFASGLRDVDEKRPVTADTLFAIGSSTKAFTTFVLATLVAEGKLTWDEPVRKWLPEFALSDAGIAERITPRDLVTHRSGMPRHDLVWYGATLSRRELVERLRWLPLSHDLRTDFQYNNLMFVTAGYLAERVGGQSWEELVAARILQPLGMKRTNLSVQQSQRDLDHAEPYRYHTGKQEHLPFRDLATVGPAGSINSSVAEMAKWVALHLMDGSSGEAVLLPAVAVQDLHDVRMPMSEGRRQPEILTIGYALGWMVDVYRGHRRVQHGGNIDGFSAMVTLLPDDGYGFVVLSNLDGTPLPELLVRNLCDRALSLPIQDWRTEMVQKLAQAETNAAKGKAGAIAERKTGTQPSHALTDFVGDYADKGYGSCKVTLVDGKLQVDFHGLVAVLEHWHYDVFRCLQSAEHPELEDTMVQFTSDLGGEIDALKVPLEPSTPEIVFARQPDAELLDPTVLGELAGKYNLHGQVATFTVQGKALVVTLPGQRHELLPATHLQWKLKDLNGYSVRFLRDDQGAVTGVRFVQPEGVFDGERMTK
jgi:CubicO group peptidase (beta-lactamase class C family)